MRIVMLEPLGVSEEVIRKLAAGFEKQGHEFVIHKDRTTEKDELAARSEKANILVLSNLPFPDEVVKRCDSLKMISVAFTGTDHIGLQACREKGIRVCNAAGYSTSSVAELAYGMMISLLRNLVGCDAATRAGKTKDGLIGNDLCGKTLGIVGSGAIGTKVAEIGRAFGCRLLAYSRTEREEVKALGVEYVDMTALMSQSDIVTLHTPLNDNTRGMINRELLGLMKPSAILINTARGPIVDSAALAGALKEGRLAGAGIDVFETEPPIKGDHPLLNVPNVLLAPHVAFATREALVRRAEIAFANVEAWLTGKDTNIVI